MSIKQQILSWGAAIIAASLVFSIGANLVVPMVNNIRFSQSPFSTVSGMEYRVEGDRLFASGTIHKTAPCDPTGAPPAYFVFRYNDIVKGTSVFLSDGQPLQSRSVVEVGVPVRFTNLNTPIPKEMRGVDGVTVELRASCQRGDNIFRAYLIAGPVDILA